MDAVRGVRADNPGPFTLDGTRTWVVGRRRPAVIDPGPAMDSHVRAVLSLLEAADEVVILVTHGHADHAAGVDSLRRGIGRDRPVRVMGAGHPLAEAIPTEGVGTDAGTLHAIPTPGHTPDHLAYHWPEGKALFSGDHLLGEGDTTWVADYPGCVADYLTSLERLRTLDLAVIYPGHGARLDDPADALERFERHRRARIAAVQRALAVEPEASTERLYRLIYADTVPAGLEEAAHRSLAALREYVDGHVDSGGWDGVSSTP